MEGSRRTRSVARAASGLVSAHPTFLRRKRARILDVCSACERCVQSKRP